MANLIWTSILYFSTSAIVFITYRTFMNDRKADNERKTADVVARTQAQAKARESASMGASRRATRTPAVVGDLKVPAAR